MAPRIDPDPQSRHAGITLRELEVLQALISAGTAISAARRLGITQSAVSRRLAQLEDRLNFLLFRREGGRLVPTVEALSINEKLTPVFDTLAQIAASGDAPQDSHMGALSIVAPPTIAHRFLPARIAAFQRANPGLQISFDILASDSLLTGIAEARYDLGITDSNVAHDGVHTDLLLETEAVCLLPVGHHLAAYDVIRPEDLHDQDFVALSRRHSSRAKIDRIFDQAGVRVRQVIETSTNVPGVEFVREGLGVSLMNPFPMIHQIGDQIVLRPFLPAIRYATNFLTPASRPPSAATQAFIQSVRAGLDPFRSHRAVGA